MNAIRIGAIFLMFLTAAACDKAAEDQEVASKSTRTQSGVEPASAEGASGTTSPVHGPNESSVANPHAGMQMASGSAGPEDASRQGEVLETMDAAGYTYALVKTSAGNIWIAGPETAVKVGDQIRFPKGTPMEKFRSNTLDREFARIDFVTEIQVNSVQNGADDTPASSPPDTSGGTGTVVETMDASGYTYALLAMKDGDEKWVAGPQVKLEVGQNVGITKGDAMDDFHSPSLDRTFERLELVGRISPLDGTADSMPSSDQKVPGASEHTTADSAGVEEMPVPEGGVAVEDIHAKQKELAGKEVTVRGKVVKFNANILNANWLHVQDGSGDPSAGTHDITVTTGETAEVGEVVTVTGTVTVNKDFGAGYKYDVMVEEATLSRE